MSGLRDAGRRGLRRAKYFVGEHPVGLPLLARLTPEGPERIVRRDTDIVIEGFPRSGNTFAVFALRHANPDLTVASHIHHVGQLRHAIALGRPTAVVVREPLACLSSYLLAGPHGRPAGVIEEYIDYHQTVESMAADLAVIGFPAVTTAMGDVTSALNQRFGLSLRAFSDTADDVDAVFAAIDAKHRRTGGRAEHEFGVARPAAARAEARDDTRALLTHPRHAARLQAATDVWERLTGIAVA